MDYIGSLTFNIIMLSVLAFIPFHVLSISMLANDCVGSDCLSGHMNNKIECKQTNMEMSAAS